MSANIRRATAEDASAFARLIAEAFNESLDAGDPDLRQALNKGTTHVAVSADCVLGFAHSFLTVSPSGSMRYELDLLAVASEARGRGIGASLIDNSLTEARLLKADLLRTLVSVANRPMQKLCRLCNLQPSETTFTLYTRPPKRIDQPSASHHAHLIEVITLNYSGIWLEGELSNYAIAAADEIAQHYAMSRIGALWQANDSQMAELMRKNDFYGSGNFDWWSTNLGSG